MKRAKGLEPSTYGLGSYADGHDTQRRSTVDAAERESPCGFAASRRAAIPHGSVGVSPDVCGMNVARLPGAGRARAGYLHALHR